MATRLLVVTTAAAAAATVTAQSSSWSGADDDAVGQYYHVTWSEAATLTKPEDAEYQVTPQDNTVNWGGLSDSRSAMCTCDLTKFSCDVTVSGGCACDPDCAAYTAHFTNTLPEGKVQSTLRYCSASVDSANLDLMDRANSEGFTLNSQFVDDQLCVIKTNNPSLGTYYTDPGALTSVDTIYSTQDTHLMQVSLDTGDFLSQTDQYTFAEQGSLAGAVQAAYGFGDPIMAFDGVSGGQCMAAAGRYMPFPTPGFSGECSDFSFASFGISEGPSLCIRRSMVALSQSCSTTFGAAAYVGNSAKFPCVAAKPGATSGTVMTVVVRDHSSSTGTPVSAGYPLPNTSYDGASGTCKNALDAVHYTVSHDSSRKITAVVAEVWFKDITETFATQNFTVSYVTWETSPSPAPMRGRSGLRSEKSGAPGYLVGALVLGGRVATTTTTDDNGLTRDRYAIKQRVGGLAVVGMGEGGACSDGARSVRFMHDMVVACTKSLDRAQLKATCQSQGTTGGVANTIYNSLLNGTDSHVGVFGDASAEFVSDWIALKQDVAVSAAQWTESTSSCEKLATEYRLTLFTAPVGSIQQPQAKIVGGFYSFGTDSVRFEQASASSLQALELRTVVTFVELPDKVLSEQLLEPPRLIPEMPADLFYPFTLELKTSGAGGLQGGRSLLLLLVLAVLGVLE